MKQVYIIKRGNEIIYKYSDNKNYLWMQNTSNSTGTFTLTKTGTPNATELYYSLDKLWWTPFNLSNSTNTVSVPAGSKIWFKGNNANGFNAGDGNRYNMSMDVSHTVGGKLASLINATDLSDNTETKSGCWTQLFLNDSTLTSASSLDVSDYMVVNSEGFRGIFQHCTSLTSIPDFSGIETVNDNGFRYAFSDTALTSIDLSNVLYVTTNSFANAFSHNSNLNYVKCPTISSWDTDYFGQWLLDVAATGTLVKQSGLSVPTGVSGIPTGWTTSNLPDLPSLTVNVYQRDYREGYNRWKLRISTSGVSGVRYYLKYSSSTYPSSVTRRDYNLTGAGSGDTSIWTTSWIGGSGYNQIYLRILATQPNYSDKSTIKMFDTNS